MPLPVKVQYKNFEPGEFTDAADRTFEATRALIEQFPWEAQRDHLQVSLTNPSVTISDNNGNFLKLALYYNGKFVLHYFDTGRHLYTKSFASYQDAFPWIQAFFEQPSFDSGDFRLENTWMQSNLVHFADKDFHYRITPQRIRSWLLRTSGVNFAFTVIFLSIMLSHLENFTIPLGLLTLFACFTIGGGINLLFLYNYYKAGRDKLLVMSRGNEVFLFGSAEAPEQFSKKDIMQCRFYRNRNSRSPTRDFVYLEIEMKDARYLIIPNLLIDYDDMMEKLSEWPYVEIHRNFPFIPRGASALS